MASGETTSIPSAATGEWRGWYATIVLAMIHAIAITDRYIVGVVVDPIRADLGLTNTQMGFVSGPAFLLIYCCLAVPLGMMADRISRKGLIAGGVMVWSLATAAIARADGFATLVLARAFIGLGEACLIPAALSLISAHFPPSRLARATSVFSLGGTMGKVLGFMGGGALFGILATMHPDAPALLAVSPWRAVFLYAALPGFALALLMLTVDEPARTVISGSRRALLKSALVQIQSHRLTYGSLLGAGAAFLATSMLLAAWAVTYFTRIHHVSAAQAGGIVGMVSLIAGVGGTIVSGVVTDMLTRRGVRSAPLFVTMAALVSMMACALNFGIGLGLGATIAVYGIFQFCLAAGPPAYLSGLQMVTPDACRATVSSITLVLITLIGGTLGPTVVGGLLDRVFTDADGIGAAFATATLAFGFAGAMSAFAGRRAFARSRFP